MTKGRNTTLLTTRIPDRMFEAVRTLATGKGMTMSEYVRSVLQVHEELRRQMMTGGADTTPGQAN